MKRYTRRLRRGVFRNLEELNMAIRKLLSKLNRRPFRKKDGTRTSLWEAIDKPALKAVKDLRCSA